MSRCFCWNIQCGVFIGHQFCFSIFGQQYNNAAPTLYWNKIKRRRGRSCNVITYLTNQFHHFCTFSLYLYNDFFFHIVYFFLGSWSDPTFQISSQVVCVFLLVYVLIVGKTLRIFFVLPHVHWYWYIQFWSDIWSLQSICLCELSWIKSTLF